MCSLFFFFLCFFTSQRRNSMKKFLLAAFVALVLSFSASAETVRLGADGSISIENPGGDRKIEGTFDDGILDDRDAWKAAIRNPGVVVPVTSHVKAERSGFFHIKKTTIIDTGVLYDGAGSVTVVRDVVQPSEMDSTPFLIMASISIFLVSVILYRNRIGKPLHWSCYFAPSGVTFLLFLSSLEVALVFNSPSVSVFSFFSLAALAWLFLKLKKETEATILSIYYLCMVVSVGTFLLS